MSVLIKGMGMPECCDVCMFSDWSNLNQTASCKLKEYEPCFANFSVEYRSKRADFCPLVALPDKHGRLIDEKDVINAIYERLHELQTHKEFIKKRGDIDLLGILPYIAKIRAIIEAEDNFQTEGGWVNV